MNEIRLKSSEYETPEFAIVEDVLIQVICTSGETSEDVGETEGQW